MMEEELFERLMRHLQDQEAISSAQESGSSMTYRRLIAKLDTLRHLLERMYRTPEARERWLQAPLSSLSGRSPLAALTDGDTDAVLKILDVRSGGKPR